MDGIEESRMATSGSSTVGRRDFTDSFYDPAVRVSHVGNSVTFCHGLWRLTLFSAQEPIDWLAHVVLFGLAHHAGDGLAGLIENDCSRHDVAKAKAVECLSVGVDPANEIDVKFGKCGGNFVTVLDVVDRNEDEVDWLARVR